MKPSNLLVINDVNVMFAAKAHISTVWPRGALVYKCEAYYLV